MTPSEILLEVDRRATEKSSAVTANFVLELRRLRGVVEQHWARAAVEAEVGETCPVARRYRKHYKEIRRHDNRLRAFHSVWDKEYFVPERPLLPDRGRCGKCRACLSQLLGQKEAAAQIHQAVEARYADKSPLFDDLLDVIVGGGGVANGEVR